LALWVYLIEESLEEGIPARSRVLHWIVLRREGKSPDTGTETTLGFGEHGDTLGISGLLRAGCGVAALLGP
jgi:hypothetical protein